MVKYTRVYTTHVTGCTVHPVPVKVKVKVKKFCVCICIHEECMCCTCSTQHTTYNTHNTTVSVYCVCTACVRFVYVVPGTCTHTHEVPGNNTGPVRTQLLSNTQTVLVLVQVVIYHTPSTHLGANVNLLVIYSGTPAYMYVCTWYRPCYACSIDRGPFG